MVQAAAHGIQPVAWSTVLHVFLPRPIPLAGAVRFGATLTCAIVTNGTWVQLDLVYLVSALIALTPLIELTPLIALSAN